MIIKYHHDYRYSFVKFSLKVVSLEVRLSVRLVGIVDKVVCKLTIDCEDCLTSSLTSERLLFNIPKLESIFLIYDNKISSRLSLFFCKILSKSSEFRS